MTFNIINSGSPSRAFEFYPVILKFKIENNIFYILDNNLKKLFRHKLTCEIINSLLRYSYTETKNDYGLLYTNARAVVNSELSLTDLPKYDDVNYSYFKVVKIKSSFIVWAQLMTHTQLSKISQSDRVTGTDEYWLPDQLAKKEEVLNQMLTVMSQDEVQRVLKQTGFKREIWSRAPYYFKMKTFIMGGWKNDPNAWENLFLERGVYPDKWKTWVQKETREVCQMIANVVNK